MGAEKPTYILDSFALLAFLGGEQAMGRIIVVLQEAKSNTCKVVMSMINLGEVAYITERRRGFQSAQAVLASIESLPIELLPVTRRAVLAAAHIKAHYPLAYADAFVIAAAQVLNGIVLTGDPEFKFVEEIVKLEWLPK